MTSTIMKAMVLALILGLSSCEREADEREPSTENPKTSSETSPHQPVTTEHTEMESSTDGIMGWDYYYPGAAWQPTPGTTYQIKVVHHDEKQSRLMLEYNVARGAPQQGAQLAMVSLSRGEPQVAIGYPYKSVKDELVPEWLNEKTGEIVLLADIPKGTKIFIAQGNLEDEGRLQSIVCLSNVIEF